MLEDRIYRYLGLYYSSPPWVKALAGRVYRTIPFRFRYGQVYAHFKNLLQSSQFWSRDQIADYQTQKMGALIHHGYHHVPYYQNIMTANGLHPSQFLSLSELRQFPFLRKEDIIQHKEKLVAVNYPKTKLLHYSTGGTMGTPLSFYNEKGVSRSKELAFMTTQWERVEYHLNDPLVTIRGNVVPSARRDHYWEYEPIKNRLVFSSYHMTDDNLKNYVKKIREFKPKYIHTYPSAAMILAKYMKDRNESPFPTVRALLCSSEAFTPGQREFLEGIFQCRIFSWYGLGEMVALAGECEVSANYHIFPEYGIFELVDPQGRVIDREGELGEIVGTGFDRDIMPFIRYRTGDYAEYLDQACACGRNHRLLKRVEGRWLQEHIITKKGNLISITALNMHSPIFEHVKRYQFVQEVSGTVILRVVPNRLYMEDDTRRIHHAFLQKFDARDIEFSIQLADDSQIEIGLTGKFKFLIQKGVRPGEKADHE